MNNVFSDLEALVRAAASAVSFECDISEQQAGNVPMFPQAMAFENFKPVIDYNGSNVGSSHGKKAVMDIMLYPRRSFDYEENHSRSISELNTELITKVGAEFLRPMVQARRIDATARGLTLPDERPATFIRIFLAEDFPCSEHSEMLLGQPLGQYHCPACGEMQMAGCFHLDREFDDEGNLIDG